MSVLFSLPQILKERFGMVAPDVQIEDGKGTILISSEEGETEGELRLMRHSNVATGLKSSVQHR